ncbi:helix-turn-helix domain-containing protein [Thauera sp.]|uniref:helix-turn-helix domain-containing protein n=1 Tax=Thauera sp. TaxID=1905334 RepID=UPI0039E31765
MPLFGDRLLEERKRLKLSQEEVAEGCGVTLRSQRNYEKCERSPDAAYLERLAAIGGDVLYILTGQKREEHRQELPADEQLLLDAYRALPVAKRKAVLASLITGATPRKSAAGPQVKGNNNRTAGGDYHEKM